MFLRHLGLEQYQDALIANVGVVCPLTTLEKTLPLTNLPRMNVQDYDHQKVGTFTTPTPTPFTYSCSYRG